MILMVAITVILAAVIAAFVLDLGGSVGQEAQAGVSLEVDNSAEEVQVEVTSLGNADHVNLSTSDTGSNWDSSDAEYLKVGDTRTFNASTSGGSPVHLENSGTISAVAVINESDTETSVGSEEWNFN
ncbi:hypothetical protein C487_12266 [Natrinema pallidum DSM 3751]|uniref:Archaeal Type IV pilin N-terminal domain-containing protein n=1 Tax=Natrinema pallidum DSM 3751 TaxID=1227495 RepID=L9YTJ5_9EURY|nr:hypothetical protein C487_12266 [Natrinema pallidum DSM 3751]